jgi:hypothetical protein
MNVAIISQGPSADGTYPNWQKDVMADQLPGGVIQIGVNFQVDAFVCDYWAFVDAATFDDAKPLGQPIAVDRGNFGGPNNFKPGSLWGSWPKILVDETWNIPVPEPGMLKWSKFSGILALGLAWKLKPTRLDLFGYDMVGESGCQDRRARVYNRSGHRWELERRVFDWWMGNFDKAGIEVKRWQ